MQPAGARKRREDDQPRSRAADLRLVTERGEREAPTPPVAERRTVVITGRTTPPPRRRPSAAQRQIAARPDRVALWAFLMGLFLVFMAAATAHAAV